MSILYIIRGLPGSGKSTLAKQIHSAISNSDQGVAHFEADMYFTDKAGNYLFEASHLQRAHNWCQVKVEQTMILGIRVIVSNTFSQLWEMQPYIDLAKTYNYQLQIIQCNGEWPSIHDVPPETVSKMRQRWEPL